MLTVAFFGNIDPTPPTPEEKHLLDEIHLRKIDLAYPIYVINKDSYIGESTAKEIEYASNQGKQITYINPQQHPPKAGA